jgi:pimeloyl-ACP methyl ester carboxylesterase
LEKVSRGSTLKIAVCLFAAAYLQTTLAQQVPVSLGRWLGHISWLLLVVVYIALQRDAVRSLMTAAAAGVIHDAFSMGLGVGVNGLAMVLAAYFADRIASVIMVDNLIFRFLPSQRGASSTPWSASASIGRSTWNSQSWPAAEKWRRLSSSTSSPISLRPFYFTSRWIASLIKAWE